MLTGAELIISERVRQMEHEGYTAAHDDEHKHGELAIAGAAYAGWAGDVAGYADLYDPVIFEWPFPMHEWKPSEDLVRTLVKAGALIAAEIDRLQRLQVKQERATAQHVPIPTTPAITEPPWRVPGDAPEHSPHSPWDDFQHTLALVRGISQEDRQALFSDAWRLVQAYPKPYQGPVPKS